MGSQQRLFCLLWGITHLHTADPQQLSGQQLSGHQLSGHQLSGQQLSGHQLSGHQLSGQQLSGQQLSGQQLSGHQLSAGALPGVSDRPAFTNSPANYSVTQGTHHGEDY
jgi:uncharacterized protein YjbI with pentapeptide repeats